MASFRKGAEAIAAAATRSGGGNFTPTHRFEAGETKYLQFLTSIEDVYTVLMHRFVIVDHKENGDPIYKDFISRRDPQLDGPEGWDDLIDRFELNPSQRCIAIAVELEPKFKKVGTKKVVDGFEIVYRDYTDAEGEEHSVPNIALVVESPYTFYTHLTAISDLKPIEDVVFAIKRTGKSTDTTYTFMEAGAALDGDVIDEVYDEFAENFDLEAWLEELADEDRMRELIEPLDDDFQVSRYQKKKGKGGKSESKPASSRSSRSQRGRARDEEPAEEPEENEEDGDDGEGEEDAAPSRSRKFSQLRSDVGGAKKRGK